MAAPRKKTTLLQPFRPPSKIKYLVEEKGADITFYHAVIAVNKTFLDNFLSLEAGTPMSVTDLAPSDEWDSAWERGGLSRPDKDMEAFSMRKGKEIETKAREREEAEAAKALFKEQKAKAKEATAALLAEFDAEDRHEAMAAAKKKSKKKGNKKKGAGSQQQQAAPVAPGDTAAGRGGGLEECKADDIRLAPQLSPQVEDEQKQQRQRAPQDAADAGAAVVAVNMGNLSLEERKAAGAPISKDEEASLEEEKHDFFFDGAPDGLKCSVGFCFMTEAVVALNGFSYQKFSLDEHIAHCAAKGQPLSSPLTG